jgi:hypothetical protein
MSGVPPEGSWIDAMTDAECMDVFSLYVDPPEPFLAAHPPALLGAAMRRALHEVARANGASREAPRADGERQ